jgi:predicted esterase
MRLIARIFAVGALIAASLAAAPASAQLRARPAIVAMTLPPGVSRIGKNAEAYRPRNAPAAALPLIVLLHGAGGDAGRFLAEFKAIADRRGAILLAPKSAGRTWDLQPRRGGGASFGRDAANLDAALAELFAKSPVDRERVVLLGFSDGASYALSLGLANPQLFRAIVGLSVGGVFPPRSVDETQRVFFAHGRRDPVLPFANVQRRIVPGLERSGLEPRVHWFNGGHVMDPDAIDEGLDFALEVER